MTPRTPSSSLAALRVLRRYLGPLWPQVALLSVLLLSSIGLNLYLPQLLASFLDSAQAHGSLSGLTRLALSYIGIAVAVQLLSAGATYLGANVGWAATNRLRADLTDHLLHLDMSFHKERTPGELIERIDGDVTALSNFFSQFAVRVFGAVLLLLGALVMFFREQWWVGLMVTVFAATTMYAMNRTRRVGVEPTRVEREASARLFGFIEERLSGLDDVRALGAGAFTVSRFLGVQRNFFWKAYQAWIKRSAVWQLSMLLFAVGYVAVISSAVGLYVGGTISIGTAFLFYQYMSLVEEPIDQLTQQLQDVQKAGASLLRVGELLNLKSELRGRHPDAACRGAGSRVSGRVVSVPGRPDRRAGQREFQRAGRAYRGPAGPHRQRQDHPDAAGVAAVRPHRRADSAGRRAHHRTGTLGPAKPHRGGDAGRAALSGDGEEQSDALRSRHFR